MFVCNLDNILLNIIYYQLLHFYQSMILNTNNKNFDEIEKFTSKFKKHV